MNKWVIIGACMGFSIFVPIILKASFEEEGRVFGQQLHGKGYEDKSAELNTLNQQFSQKPENQHYQSQTSNLSTTFEQNFDHGKKSEDPLKSHFNRKTVEATKNTPLTQPTLGETELLLKQKHRFEVSPQDDLFKKHQEISNTEIDNQMPHFQKGQPPVQSKTDLQDKIVTCRKGVAPTYQSCTKQLIIKTTPQEPLVKTVTAYFTARCYNLVTFSIDLKTGHIRVSQCENQGPVSVSVDNPIGEPDYPNQTTVQLIGNRHFGEGGVDFRAGQMNPSHTNGFTASFTAFQPKTGKKHDGNKNHVRGGQYIWKITMPRKPKLERYWEGCEDLERHAIEQSCELVEQELQNVHETKTIPGFGPMTEPYWSEHKGFLCGGGRDIDECETLVQQQCEQIHSKCVVLKDKICIEYENTFRCRVPEYLKGDGLKFNHGTLGFLSGKREPAQEGYSAEDFAEAITHFSALTEMGKEMQDNLGGIVGDPNNPSVFQGKCHQCRVNLGSFVRDCCKLKGVLQGLLGRCNEEEKQLAVAAIKNKRCVKIEGRYCHKKVAGVCTEKRDSYCCYGSQLARILQEITHQQLGLSWGDAKDPHCESLTASQLSQLDFDTPYAQQKLGEIVSEVQASSQDKFNRVQQAVAASKNLQLKAKEWEAKQTQVEKETKERVEQQHRYFQQVNP